MLRALVNPTAVLIAVQACCVAVGAAEPINDTCPMSGRAFDEPVATAQYEGMEIGFCCGGCKAKFVELSADEQRNLLTAWLDGDGTGTAPNATDAPVTDQAGAGDPFPLAKCPVSGETLGESDSAVIERIDGREVRFCCPGCIDTFRMSSEAYFKAIDKELIASQAPYYPLASCIACEAPPEDGEPLQLQFVVGNRLFRACGQECREKVERDPAQAWKHLDEAVMNAQRSRYPMDTCLVSGMTLGEMGEPYEIVIANRLIRFCCAGCEMAVRMNTGEYLATLDDAWRTKFSDGLPDWSIQEEGDAAQQPD